MALKLTYSVHEACDAIGIGSTKFFELVRDGQIRTIKLGRRTLVPAEELHRLLA